MGDSAGTRRRSIDLVSRAVELLAQVEAWPPQTVAVGVLLDGEVVGAHGPRDRVFRWASVTKLATALAVLVAAEEGVAGRGALRHARRPAAVRRPPAAAEPGRARDARGGDLRPVPGPRRRPAGHRPDGSERLGARVRAPRRKVAALDGHAEFAADVRA